MNGTLYVVGTPIGNLGDITQRQLTILASVHVIAAEDTRVTRKLLSHFDIHTPLMSYHEHSAQTVIDAIVEKLQTAQDCAVVTDAGMPCISDPGALLVQRCISEGIAVQVIPGPSAVISALAVSGQDTGRFCFEGFLSVTKKQRIAHLEQLRTEQRTIVFYEAPHKLKNTLQDLLAYLGDRSISICRELTKIHEEVRKTTLSEAVAYYELVAPRGEYVLVLAGAVPEEKEQSQSLEEVVTAIRERMAKGERATDVCREYALSSGFSKRVLYQAVTRDGESDSE